MNTKQGPMSTPVSVTIIEPLPWGIDKPSEGKMRRGFSLTILTGIESSLLLVMTMKYLQIRAELAESPQSDWEAIVERAVDEDGSLENLVKGRIQGKGIRDVSVDEDSIMATAELMVLGDAVQDEDGPYQDNDGEGYDYEEDELTFYLTIDHRGFTWTKE
jgi:hypothetical protein